MASYSEKGVNIPKLIMELRQLQRLNVVIGVIGEPNSDLAKYAGANEFGATIKPNGHRFLAVPLRQEAKEKSPREFSDLVFIPPAKGEKKRPILAKVVDGTVMPYYVLMDKVEIPERSFLRSAIDDKAEQEKALSIGIKKMRQLFVGNGSALQVMAAIGNTLADSVRKKILSNVTPANRPLTIELKGHAQTLIGEDRRLYKSIGFEVVG